MPNAFSVGPASIQNPGLSLRSNPGLELANAFGVILEGIPERSRLHYDVGKEALLGWSTRSKLHFLNNFANAARASVGAPDEVSRSITVRGANSSQVLRAFLFTIFAVIGLLHSKRAPGSKYVH